VESRAATMSGSALPDMSRDAPHLLPPYGSPNRGGLIVTKVSGKFCDKGSENDSRSVCVLTL